MVTSAVVPALPTVRRRAIGDTAGSRSATARPLPIPPLPCPSAREAVYGVAILDRYGRLAERTVLRALRWGPGHPLALTLVSGSVLVVANVNSTARIGNDGYFRLPVGVRRACRLAAGDRVLLVAEPATGRLLLHPPAALGALLDAHHADILRGATP